jgi:tetratricopeptide (TPR) repeat protein
VDHKVLKKVEEPLSINIFTTSGGAGKSTAGVNGQFVFSQVLIDCLLRLKTNPTDKSELITLCKNEYKGNNDERNNLREFEQDYSPNKVLWWYTRESFFYKTLNAALRNQNIHMIFLFRAFISDIHRQLQRYQAKRPIRVYRSQMISSVELKTLKECLGQLISVNSFFSTSTDYEKALSFLSMSDASCDLERVLFEIDADPQKVTTKPFADVSAHSDFTDESEVLFMLGSIFRLNSINRGDNEVWIIRMALCSDDENDLKQVLLHMKQQIGSGETNLRILGKVLWKMGKLDLAEKYFNRLLKDLSPNDPLLSSLYEDLGELASLREDYDMSMQWHQKSLAIKDKNQLTSNPIISKTSNPVIGKTSNPISKYIEEESIIFKLASYMKIDILLLKTILIKLRTE